MKKAMWILGIIATVCIVSAVAMLGFMKYTSEPRRNLQSLIDTEIQNTEKYTSSSLNNYENEIKNANAILSNPFASKEKLDAAKKDLQNSIDSLTIATKGVYQFSVSFTELSNNSVGKEWSKALYYNGMNIQTGSTLTKNLNEKISLNAIIKENDRLADIGTGRIELTLVDGATASSIITVIENAGRYKGNTAQWRVDVSVSLIERR